jgi:multidrug efflux pump subunit AcrB
MEEVLQGLPGMEVMEANAFNGGAGIDLRFALGTDMQAVLMDVIGRLNRLPPLPADADPPVVQLGGRGAANATLTFYFVQKLPGTPGQLTDYSRQVEDLVRSRVESIEGVSGIEILDGAPMELQIIIDPYRAAELGLPLTDIALRASRANDTSGGFVDVGRRQYTLRFEGRYDPEQLRNQVLEWRDGRPVRLGDIAEVRVGRGQRQDIVVQNGNPAMGIRINRQNGANVLAALTEVKQVMAELRDGPMKEMGLDLQQSFDASVFIQRAVKLVTSNLLIGIMLAVGVLWWFLRDARGFAVGMVLDAAIVVSENIVRLRERGISAGRAALQGASQVQGALFASTATTVAIFLPVLFLEDVEGQLFADLALTIAIAVCASLLVALTVLPAIGGNWLTHRKLGNHHAPVWSRLAGLLMRASSTHWRRAGIITKLVVLPLALTWALFPQLDYLPPVKRDAVDAFLQTPPGATWDTKENEIVSTLVERLAPYMSGEKQPALKNYYIWMFRGGGTIGARVLDQSRVGELEKIMREEILVGIPDFRGFAAQGNLFGGFGGGRDIAVHMQSANEAGLIEASAAGQQQLMGAFPGANVRAFPSPELAEPELRILPDDARISEVGWNRNSVASVIRTLGNGLWLGEYFNGEDRMDIILKADGWETPEQLANTPVMTPVGGVVPLGELVGVQRTTGPGQIRRVNGRRTVSLTLSPPENVSLETAVQRIREDVEPSLRDALPEDGTVIYGGSADSLSDAMETMSANFLVALMILFLLMAGLFRSLRDSAIVVLTIPLAGVGGILSLQVLNLFTFQPMDLLTMIGFIILLGLVVNNAILLVDQTRRAEREGLDRHSAVEKALSIRMRPIFMSTFTTIFGMLPLVLMPGEGSVIYRGLAAAIVGGMVCSLLFTLLMLPSLLRIGRAPAAERRPEQLPQEARLESTV